MLKFRGVVCQGKPTGREENGTLPRTEPMGLEWPGILCFPRPECSAFLAFLGDLSVLTHRCFSLI